MSAAMKLNPQEIAKKYNLKEHMTIEEVMVYARCSKRHIEDEIKRGNLRAYKPVKHLEFDPTDVAAWFKKKVKK